MSFNPQYLVSPPTMTDKQFSTGRVDANGNLLVATSANAAGGSTTTPEYVVGPYSTTATGTIITRPADTNIYAVGDLIANSTTAGSVTPIQFTISRASDTPFLMRRVRIKINDTPWKSATVRLHLFKNSQSLLKH